jgi:Na+-driven multidrug efflux pump
MRFSLAGDQNLNSYSTPYRVNCVRFYAAVFSRSTSRIILQIAAIISQIFVPLGVCFTIQRLSTLDPIDIWFAILLGHATRCVLSILRFNQGHWLAIKVE